MWDLIVSVPDHCLSFYFVCFEWSLCVCVFELNVAFNNFSVISRRCLVAAGSSMLTFIAIKYLDPD